MFSLSRSTLATIESKLKMSNAAIHVRRGDKIQEAYFYDIEKYLELVEDNSKIQKAQNIDSNERLYIATDDPR